MDLVPTKDLTMNRTNAIRNLSLSLLLAATAFAAPAYAHVSLNINVGPPAPQYEVVPTIAPGYVWAPGYWGWSGERHVWVRGRAIVQRDGYRWEPDRWEQRDRGYFRTAGHWARDRGDRGHDNGKHGKGGRRGD
jgi:hypothetical protein